MADALEILRPDYPLRLARMGRSVFIDIFDPDAATNAEDLMDPARSVADQILQEGAAEVRFCIRIRRGSGLPSSDKREAMQRWLHRRKGLGRGVVWLEGEGFWAAAFRALLSAFLLTTGQRSILTIVSSGEELRGAADLDGEDEATIDAFFSVEHPAQAA